MSIETKPNVEYHAMAIAIGLSGLRIKKDYDISTPELEEFNSYLKETREFTLPNSLGSVQTLMNDALKNVKTFIKENKIIDAIIEAEKIYNHLHSIHEKV